MVMMHAEFLVAQPDRLAVFWVDMRVFLVSAALQERWVVMELVMVGILAMVLVDALVSPALNVRRVSVPVLVYNAVAILVALHGRLVVSLVDKQVLMAFQVRRVLGLVMVGNKAAILVVPRDRWVGFVVDALVFQVRRVLVLVMVGNNVVVFLVDEKVYLAL